MVLYCIILYYIVLWYYGIMVLLYILFFVSFLSAGVAASGNSFSEPVSKKMYYGIILYYIVLYGIIWYYMVYIYIYIY